MPRLSRQELEKENASLRGQIADHEEDLRILTEAHDREIRYMRNAMTAVHDRYHRMFSHLKSFVGTCHNDMIEFVTAINRGTQPPPSDVLKDKPHIDFLADPEPYIDFLADPDATS